MKKITFHKVILVSCIIVLSLVTTTFVVAVKPAPRTRVAKPGYIMFRDSDQYAIRSDGQGAYPDCSFGGSDMVEIYVWSDTGSFNSAELYIGVMQKQFYNCSYDQWSTRRLRFHFNVSGITGNTPTGLAVRDILRWYRNESGGLTERCASNPGSILDDSLRVPIAINVAWANSGNDQIQFAIEPKLYKDSPPEPGVDPKAVTQTKVDDFYTNDINVAYWCTRTEPDKEPAPYVIYIIDYGDNGFDIQPVAWGTDGKPVTWIVKTKSRKPNQPVRLTVIKDNVSGEKVYLASYTNLPMEFALSLNSLAGYPSANPAPAKMTRTSTFWGEIKSR